MKEDAHVPQDNDRHRGGHGRPRGGADGHTRLRRRGHAVEVTPAPVSATPAPCPLTESQLASGRQAVAQALRTVDHGWQVLDNGSGEARPELTPVANPAAVADAATCALAVADLTAKTIAAQVAVAQLGVCLLTGAPCNPERSNAVAALHAVEVALNNLKRACPWLTL